VKLINTNYTNKSTPYFYEQSGSTIRYRFYEINSEKGIFGDRDASVHYDVSEISEERRTGYSRAGNYFKRFFEVYNEYGCYANRVYIVADKTVSGNGVSLAAGTKFTLS